MTEGFGRWEKTIRYIPIVKPKPYLSLPFSSKRCGRCSCIPQRGYAWNCVSPQILAERPFPLGVIFVLCPRGCSLSSRRAGRAPSLPLETRRLLLLKTGALGDVFSCGVSPSRPRCLYLPSSLSGPVTPLPLSPQRLSRPAAVTAAGGRWRGRHVGLGPSQPAALPSVIAAMWS